MLHVLDCITHQHDLRLVLLAGFICAFASWSAVSLASRARISVGRTRSMWIVAAGMVFGTGVWATHFVSMLAYQSPLKIGYDLIPTVLSVVAAVVLSILGFTVVLRPGLAAVGGTILGVAICAMHFIGMQAIEGPFILVWNGYYIAASVLLCVALAVLSAFAGVGIRHVGGRVLAAALLALGVCTLHFTGVSALTLVPDPNVWYDDIILAPDALAVSIAAAALLIVALGLVAAVLDSHLALRKTSEAERLRAYIIELEATHHALKVTSAELEVALVKASAASSAKSTFLAAMSHELRTPLNAVIGFSDLILSETFGPLGARYRGYVNAIHKSGKHLLALINDVLDLSRLDADKDDFREERISLTTILQDVMHMISAQAQNDGIRLSLDSHIDESDMTIDPRRLRQILLNILSNAIKFTPAGGSVTVSLWRSETGASIQIKDTGIGIATNDMARAFERFGQIDSRLSRKYEGTGLGLPIAKQLTEKMGGSLALASDVGVGTIVTITLPAWRFVDASHRVQAA